MGWFVVGDAPPGPVPSTAAELAWNCAKELLAKSDWSMLPDVPMTAAEKDAWVEYRRALRDIRLQSGFPDNIQWPVRPE